MSDELDLVALYRTMQLIRTFEETALALRLEDRIYGTMHPYVGQESIAAGVIQALGEQDRLVSNHRGHGHLIARGADPGRMMAELLGRVDGYCRGKGGSMHIADFSIGVLGANGIVGAGLPLAAGSALAAQVLGDDAVTVGFFGDGATGEGAFHEALNLSALERLPVVWVCENNQYADRTPAAASLPTNNVAGYGHGYGIPSETVDGTDVVAVAEAAGRAVARARRGEGPTLLEYRVFRFGVHAQRGVPIADPRPADERDRWRERDPLLLLAARIVQRGDATEDLLGRVRDEVRQLIDEAVAFAEASPFPDPAEAFEGVFA
jgi:TPP-dependent pyruvate/acetoin dehydrogenase alpha subunit